MCGRTCVCVCVCLLLTATATSPHWGQVAHWLQGSTCERAGPEARRGWQPPPIGGKLSPAPIHGSHWKQTGNSTIFCGKSNIFWEKTGNSTIPAPYGPRCCRYADAVMDAMVLMVPSLVANPRRCWVDLRSNPFIAASWSGQLSGTQVVMISGVDFGGKET